jgi:hypothetical protein
MTEPKDSREVKCRAFMNQSLHVHHDLVGSGDDKKDLVSVEGPRCSLDLSKAEALDFAAAIVWAANGGRKG